MAESQEGLPCRMGPRIAVGRRLLGRGPALVDENQTLEERGPHRGETRPPHVRQDQECGASGIEPLAKKRKKANSPLKKRLETNRKVPTTKMKSRDMVTVKVIEWKNQRTP